MLKVLSVTQRQAITQSVSQHGAAYHGDLSKSVTHLVAAVPQGKKYEFARQWGITVVTLQWITDSLRRRMALEGAYYDPTLPTERQGQGAFKEFLPEHVQLEKRARDEEAAQKASEIGRKKLRRTASAKLGSQNLELWQNITAGSDNTPRHVNNNWTDPDATADAARWTEIAPLECQNGNGLAEKARLSTSDVAKLNDRPKQGIFQGRLIYIHGFDSNKAGYFSSKTITMVATNFPDVYRPQSYSLISKQMALPLVHLKQIFRLLQMMTSRKELCLCHTMCQGSV